MELNERISLFSEMVLCCHDLYLWTFDAELNLISCNCPEAELITRLADHAVWKNTLRSYAEKHGKPIIMSGRPGLTWIAIPHPSEASGMCIYILGPVATDDIPSSSVNAMLRKTELSAALKERASRFIASLPIITLNRLFEYAIMLYFCITGERILVSDLHYEESEPSAPASGQRRPKKTDVHGTYAMEQEMVRMVREGNLDYQKHMSRLAVSGSIGKLSDNPERQMKNAVLVCIVLFSRAAIEGGVAPEIAMTLTDHYFQSVEACRSTQELQQITRTMQDDFVQRVHKVRTRSLSRPIQECCDYLDLHMDEDVSLRQMALHLGYSEYYLSHKFREETGKSFRDYVLQRRLAKAPDLLRNSALTVKDVAEMLHFCSQSYFAEQFKAVYGMSPSKWREAQ